MDMRSQDQALIRQLMELHSGILELKQELYEEEVSEEEEEEGVSYWDSGSEGGTGSTYCSSGESFSIPFWKMEPTLNFGLLSRRSFNRRSSVP